ncbi:MAG: tyrosine-type recombinase/integrase [Candidatus Caenarcaniphilales bacterium]|nr:tyrosine-type recombinase/integrase [Candidatus Caenarcaniphilales bacterium]
MTAIDIARDLKLGKHTILKYFREGFLPSKQVYNSQNKLTYVIEEDKYQTWKAKHFKGIKVTEINKFKSHLREASLEKIKELSLEWLDWCKTGKLTGRPLSPRTVEIYRTYFKLYLDTLPNYPERPIISINNLRNVLGTFSPERFSTKRNIYDSIMSFSKYLIELEFQDESLRDKMKKLKPKRFIPAKKTSITEKELQKIYSYIETSLNSDYGKLLNKTLICFLINTGLRASELCNLKLEDVDLNRKRIYVWLGKGNKNRIVGINEELYNQLTAYLKIRLEFYNNFSNCFLSNAKKPFEVVALGRKIRRITDGAGLKNISPHSLRRSFVTINSAKGKPLNHLRIACGHADITTTQSYCMTTVEEVVEAMAEW